MDVNRSEKEPDLFRFIAIHQICGLGCSDCAGACRPLLNILSTRELNQINQVAKNEQSRQTTSH
jgi:hypothetical protein